MGHRESIDVWYAMTITCVADAESLVGRTFERDGLQRIVKCIDIVREPSGRQSVFMIAWRRPGCRRWTYRSRLAHFNVWLAGATEVSKDIVVNMDCGCAVTFRAASGWKLPAVVACGDHSGMASDRVLAVIESAVRLRDNLMADRAIESLHPVEGRQV